MNDSELLGSAVQNAADLISIDLSALSEITGIAEDEWTSNRKELTPVQKDYCIKIVRVSKALTSLMSSDRPNMVDWVHTKNSAFKSAPIECMKTAEGLRHVAEYLEHHVAAGFG